MRVGIREEPRIIMARFQNVFSSMERISTNKVVTLVTLSFERS